MQVTANTSNVQASSAVGTSAATAVAAKKSLGQEDFLKLLTVQLANQDPTKPMDDTAFTAQMAQFSSLEQTSNMVKQLGLLRNDGQLQAATSMIGRQVSLQTAEGNVTGVVDSVETDEAQNISLSIAGQKYLYNQVYKVEAAPGTALAHLPAA